MRYLIISNKLEPFFTEWFDSENNFVKDVEMMVFDLRKFVYTKDGVNWFRIQEDHL